MSKTKLEVGDKIASEYYGKYSYLGTVSRLTKTRAFVRINDNIEQAFRIEIGSYSYLDIVPRPEWHNTLYMLMTPEIEEKIKEQNQISRADILMREISAKNISPEDRETIINILSKYKK